MRRAAGAVVHSACLRSAAPCVRVAPADAAPVSHVAAGLPARALPRLRRRVAGSVAGVSPLQAGRDCPAAGSPPAAASAFIERQGRRSARAPPPPAQDARSPPSRPVSPPPPASQSGGAMAHPPSVAGPVAPTLSEPPADRLASLHPDGAGDRQQRGGGGSCSDRQQGVQQAFAARTAAQSRCRRRRGSIHPARPGLRLSSPAHLSLSFSLSLSLPLSLCRAGDGARPHRPPLGGGVIRPPALLMRRLAVVCPPRSRICSAVYVWSRLSPQGNCPRSVTASSSRYADGACQTDIFQRRLGKIA